MGTGRMKILFLGLASTYTEGMTYQDNYYCLLTVEKGFDVTYISNPEKFIDGKIVDVAPSDNFTDDGYRLIRVPYKKIINDTITKKVRVFEGVYDLINQISPDVIYCHNSQYWNILDVVKYKRNNPRVLFYIDTHTSKMNSAQTWLSLNVLHKLYYKTLLKVAIKYSDGYFYVGEDEKEFSNQVYNIPITNMKYYPLGGTLLSKDEFELFREEKRKELNVYKDELLLIHTGKLDELKKTELLLRAFSSVPDLKAKLVIIGSIPKSREAIIEPLINNDNRIAFLGWKSGNELQKYLCAADLYCQPGSVSATLQNAICNYCAIMSYPHKSYVKALDFNQFIWTKDYNEIVDSLIKIDKGEINIDILKCNSEECAKELLDYRKMINCIFG